MPEISVIVPVYNVEKYIRKCLDSIINQTFKDIEIICVNDGSTDKSREILTEYQKKDSRIKIIDKKNGGLSSARNAGLKAAQGKFISFIDSDDWAEKTMLEKLYNNITALNSDISICAVHQYDETKQEINDSSKYFTLGFFDETFDNKAFTYKDVKPFIMDVCVMAWNKLYRKSLIEECRAEFPDGLIWEDGPFFFSIFFKAEGVSIVRDFLYYYRINRKGSIIQKGGKQFLDIIDVVELMYNSIKDLPDFDDIKNEFYIRKIDDIVYRYNLVNFYYKQLFSNKLKKKSFLFDGNIFDFKLADKYPGNIRKRLFDIIKKTNLLRYYYNKFKTRVMFKIMQILYTENNIYYLKYRKIVVRFKKRPEYCDIWYENDKIYIVLFKKLKFTVKFEYSKIEPINK